MVTATDAATSPPENTRANFMSVWSTAFARLVAWKNEMKDLEMSHRWESTTAYPNIITLVPLHLSQ